jgi:hypothetical protein
MKMKSAKAMSYRDSQTACCNPLFFLRRREDLATAVLQAIDTSLSRAVKFDSGFVESEKGGKEKITAPGLPGKDIREAWKGVLKRPERYHTLEPDVIPHPTQAGPDTRSVHTYLCDRYWDTTPSSL